MMTLETSPLKKWQNELWASLNHVIEDHSNLRLCLFCFIPKGLAICQKRNKNGVERREMIWFYATGQPCARWTMILCYMMQITRQTNIILILTRKILISYKSYQNVWNKNMRQNNLHKKKKFFFLSIRLQYRQISLIWMEVSFEIDIGVILESAIVEWAQVTH